MRTLKILDEGGDQTVNRAPLRSVLLLLVLLVAGCGLTIGATAPELVSPVNGTTIVCLAGDADDATGYLFVWRAVPNAITYMLELYNAGGTLIGGQTITGTPPAANALHPETALACGATYQWRVGVTFATTPPGWSGRWSFTIASPP